MIRRSRLRQWAAQHIEWGYLILGVMIGVLLNPLMRTLDPDGVQAFLDNLVPEAVGITFTVLILDRLNAMREGRLLRQQLVRRSHSRYNHTALSAIEELRVLGHLEDGTLANQSLRGAAWQDANLYRANLRNTDLGNAILLGADFVQADLYGANLNEAQMACCKAMRSATMPDGSRYDGRYNLPGDLFDARRDDVNPDDDAAMADWYGVPLTAYRQGQDWARANLHRFTRWEMPTEPPIL